MEEKLIDKRRRLFWIIDFLNKDIDGLGSGDFLKVAAEIGNNFNTLYLLPFGRKFDEGVDSFFDFPDVPPLDTPEWRGSIKEKQQRLRIFLANLIKARDNIFDSKVVVLKHNVTHMVDVTAGKLMAWPSPGDNDLEYEFACLIYDCSPDRVKAYRNLDYIKRCQVPDCQNFFLQFYKKKKQYCSNQCAWRAYSADRRAKEKKRDDGKKGEK